MKCIKFTSIGDQNRKYLYNIVITSKYKYQQKILMYLSFIYLTNIFMQNST